MAVDTFIVRWARLMLECSYVSIPATLAVIGNERGYAGWYFAALAVTLPCGLASFVGIYGGFAAIRGIGDLVASSTTSNGADAAWFDAAIDVLRVGMFVGAAILNVVLLEMLLRYRAGRSDRRNSAAAA
jgi:predicted ABC-type sugar transport system permease subunit